MLYVSHINVDNTISVKDSATKQLMHIPQKQFENPNANLPVILGVFRNGMHIEIHEITWENGSDCLESVINTIQNPTIRQYADIIRHIIPPYIFQIPASSTGKYHPASDAGEGGLKRHLISVTKTLDYLTQPAFSKKMFSSDEIDLMKVACFMHDGLKNGWTQEKYTRFDHPLLMANAIRGCNLILPVNMIEFIAHCIESHMGEWNTSSYAPNVILPIPSDKYQYFVHLADYLASRNDIGYVLNGNVYYQEGQTPVKIGGVSKIALEDKDVVVLQKAIHKASSAQITKKQKETLGITRTQAEVVDIWNTMLQYKNCSDKQQKYLDLAKVFIK